MIGCQQFCKCLQGPNSGSTDIKKKKGKASCQRASSTAVLMILINKRAALSCIDQYVYLKALCISMGSISFQHHHPESGAVG